MDDTKIKSTLGGILQVVDIPALIEIMPKGAKYLILPKDRYELIRENNDRYMLMIKE